jgi:outer membrane protein
MRSLRLVLTLGVTAQLAAAQTPATGPSRLTLDEAITLARQNNPGFLITATNERSADLNVRSAYGNLMPQSSASFGTSYQQAGTQFVQGIALSGSSDVVQSSYRVSLGVSASGSSLLAPKAAKANRDATSAEIEGAAEALRGQVTQQYISALQSEARAAVQDTLVVTAKAQLELVKARMEVGAGNTLEVRRAEVALGQAEAAAVGAHNTAQIDKLRLYQTMGVLMPRGGAQLTTTFAVSRPTFSVDSLIDLAKRVNPDLIALRSRQTASNVNVRMARSAYLPSGSISTGLGGNSQQYTNSEFLVAQAAASRASSQRNCMVTDSIRVGAGLGSLNCQGIVFTDADAEAIRAGNQGKFFDYNRNPFSLSAGFSIPLFDGFRREQNVEQAKIGLYNAQLTVKARELQVHTDVTAAYLNLVAALRTVELQEQNALKAREELSFAEERYRVGAAIFLDVTVSRGTYQQAQIDRVNAVYDYHKAFAALEAAVGRPLR